MKKSKTTESKEKNSKKAVEPVQERSIDSLSRDELFLYLKTEFERSHKNKRDLKEAICVTYRDANEYDWFNQDEVQSLINYTMVNCVARVEFDRYMIEAKDIISKIINKNTEINKYLTKKDNVIQLDFFTVSQIKTEKLELIDRLKEIEDHVEKLNKFKNCKKEDGANAKRNTMLVKMSDLISRAVSDDDVFDKSGIKTEDLNHFDSWEQNHKVVSLHELKNYFMQSIWNGVAKHYNKYTETVFDEDGAMAVELSSVLDRNGESSNTLVLDTISSNDCLGMSGANQDGMEIINSKLHVQKKLELLYPLLKEVERDVLDDLIEHHLTIDEICKKRSFNYTKVQQIKRRIFNKLEKVDLFYDAA